MAIGRILYIDGMRCAGKSTQMQLITRELRKRRKSYTIINEKYFEPFKSTVENWKRFSQKCRYDFDDIVQFADTRGQTHKLHFVPLVPQLDYLLFYRSYYTSAVNQSGESHDMTEIVNLNRQAGALLPNRTVILVCPVCVALARLEQRNRHIQSELFNTSDTHAHTFARMAKRYSQLAKTYGEVRVLDTDTNREETLQQILQWFQI